MHQGSNSCQFQYSKQVKISQCNSGPLGNKAGNKYVQIIDMRGPYLREYCISGRTKCQRNSRICTYCCAVIDSTAMNKFYFPLSKFSLFIMGNHCNTVLNLSKLNKITESEPQPYIIILKHMHYLRTLHIVWSLVRRRVTRRLTRLLTMYDIPKYRITW